jgi:ArsR family transcriptional regulator, arsenate/arsenite/antimonite-responsive transcriptional repressor / arsenate reductase (thioredoxin)
MLPSPYCGHIFKRKRWGMTKAEAMAVLAALSQETRMDIFRMLVQHKEGMAAGEIGTRLKLPFTTLSFHLSHLKHAGLIAPRRQSKTVFYDAKVRTIDNVVAFLAENCRGRSSRPVEKKSTALSPPMRVLFLCTRNSARSIMAEAAMNRWGRGRFLAFSAGSDPARSINPHALEVLKNLHYPTDELHSKSWDEFAGPDANPLNFVFTLCDRAAAEPCPAWRGQPIRAHWGIPDPIAFKGTKTSIRAEFSKTYATLEQRIRIFASLPIETLERFALQRWVAEIGNLDLAAA